MTDADMRRVAELAAEVRATTQRLRVLDAEHAANTRRAGEIGRATSEARQARDRAWGELERIISGREPEDGEA